jgi:CRP-like cAMP-binding protein
MSEVASPFFWFLQNVDLFRELPESEAAKLGAPPASVLLLAAGEKLEAGKGEPLPLVLVREGELRAWASPEDEGDPGELVGILGPGDLFGETAGGAGEGSGAGEIDAASLVAIAPAKLLVLPPDPFEERLGPLPGPGALRFRGVFPVRERVPLHRLLRRGTAARSAAVLLGEAGAGDRVRTGRGSLAALAACWRDAFELELERLEGAGAVKLGLFSIGIRDRAALERLAGERLPPPSPRAAGPDEKPEGA